MNHSPLSTQALRLNLSAHSMAYLQIRSMLCRLIMNFEMELCEDSLNWKDQKARLLWDMPPLNAKLTHRKT